MKEKSQIIFWLVGIVISSLAIVGVLSLFSHGKDFKGTEVNQIVNEVILNREQMLVDKESVKFGSESEINILILGIDARKGYDEPHCDAIHMMTLDLSDWTIRFTSVPRGTYSYIPPGNYAENEYYLANACAFAGLDYGIEQIEKIVGVKADYYLTVGFSQVLGILRVFDMPTTESLQWLRHRQSYAIGDPQRSHNQAVFLKDMIIMQFPTIDKYWSRPMLYLLFSMVDTDMDFDTGYSLLRGFVDSGIHERPDDISLFMRPYHKTVDYHLDLENPTDQIENLLNRIAPYLSSEDFSGKTLSDIQGELVSYLNDQLTSGEDLEIVIEQQLWLQVEDDDLREELHYAFIEKYAYQVFDDDPNKVLDILSIYIMEKELLENLEWAELGRGLLTYFVAQSDD